MPKTEIKHKPERSQSPKKVPGRQYEAETLTLQSLRLIAAPNASDDLSDEELADVCKGKRGYSSALVKTLIEHIKSI